MDSVIQRSLNTVVRELGINEIGLVISFYSSLSRDTVVSRFMCLLKTTDNYVRSAFTQGMVYGVFIDEELVGVGEAIPIDSTTVEVAFTVKDEYQGKGFGTRLASYMLEDLKKRGFTRAIAYTSLGNYKMLRLGRRLGGIVKCEYGECTIIFNLAARHPNLN